MSFIDWDPSLSVDVEILDDDHKRLLAIVNCIHDVWCETKPMSAVLNRLFDDLVDYSDEHFSREESRMAARGYHGLSAHRQAHQRMRRQLSEFRSRYLSGKNPDRLNREVERFLKSWLMDHIRSEDLKYKGYLVG